MNDKKPFLLFVIIFCLVGSYYLLSKELSKAVKSKTNIQSSQQKKAENIIVEVPPLQAPSETAQSPEVNKQIINSKIEKPKPPSPFKAEIEKCHQNFDSFIGSLEKKIKKVNWLPRNGVTNFFLNGVSSILGYGNVNIKDLEFLDRFFANKEMRIKKIENLPKEDHNVEYIVSFFEKFDKTTKSKEDLVALLEKHTKTKLDAPQDANKKDERGNYHISDEKYFDCTTCNLFIVHIFEERLKHN